ncbi:MAG: ComF family protein [Proteobacteria bacterium]|nr:ComF family protein [Pseudomonadota bacterium]
MIVPPEVSSKSKLNHLFAATLEGLFPNYCYLCGLRSHREQPLCHGCQDDLSANETCCSRCALPLSQAEPQLAQGNTPLQRLCGQCLASPPAFDRALAPCLYEEQMAFLLHRWKFHAERRLSTLFAYLWLSQVSKQLAIPDIIVPVPLHWTKTWQRGFNQSELFAVELRRQCRELRKVKLDTRLVQRHRATSAQSGLAAGERQANMRGAFTARRRCDNLRVAIVDDVLTTGATAAAIATTLRDAGASHIEIWCLARTPEPQY